MRLLTSTWCCITDTRQWCSQRWRTASSTDSQFTHCTLRRPRRRRCGTRLVMTSRTARRLLLQTAALSYQCCLVISLIDLLATYTVAIAAANQRDNLVLLTGNPHFPLHLFPPRHFSLRHSPEKNSPINVPGNWEIFSSSWQWKLIAIDLEISLSALALWIEIFCY